MPRPEPKFVTFEIDGREVAAPEGSMLVDAAKYGDVEIPYFCYEPKLGQPVGACRMCLVEIEGMPKLQTACSTPVKDGMVVVTTSDRVKQAQNAIVEFLLVNHPLDCPVCDKGGECPLQDISYGWGPGRSRFIEPKRHFRKPLELSPLVAIDRERMNEDVEDGWLCDKGRFGYQAVHAADRVTAPIVREGGALLERSWEFALDRVADALEKAGAKTALIAGGETTNEEAFLAQRMMRDVLGSPDIDARTGGVLDAEQARVLARPELAASVPDVEFAGAVLVVETELQDEMPILELRVRKGRRRQGVKVAVATSHPSALDRDASA